jgi:G3E family GTPase
VNLDGFILGETVPMEEMLSGCICCTIRGDLGMAIQNIYLEHHPDVIFIESTGVANPMEIMDSVTDSSLLIEVALKSIVTVINAPHLLELTQSKQGKTFQLMQDQIRCATALILNKIDQVTSGELHGLESIIRAWNPYTPIHGAVYCGIDIQLFEELGDTKLERKPSVEHEKHDAREHKEHTHNWEQEQEHEHEHEIHVHNEKEHHHSHDHVMVYTHYFDRPINSTEFENLIRALPKEVYRAKGILQFGDTASLFLFQFAYREIEFIKITPQAKVPCVAVFIGENFSKEAVKAALDKL